MRTELHFLGIIIDLFYVDTVYTKDFSKYQGIPAFYNQGGLLYFEFPYGESHGRLLERMLTVDYELYKLSYPVDDGKIVFYDANDDILKTWKFKDTPIVHYKVKFDPNGVGMQVEMILSPAIQDYGCKIHRSWHITPIKEETYQSPIYTTEQEKPKEEIIESWWSSDIEGKNRTNKASIGETAYFHIKTKNIENNKELSFNLIDQGLNIIGNQEKIAVNYKTNVINNKVVIDLNLNPDWDEVFANEPNTENLKVKLSWETILNGTKKALLNQEKDFLEIIKKGYGFTFIIFEEILPSGKITRKVLVPEPTSTSQYLKQSIKATHYENFGMQPKSSNSTVTIAEHIANNKPSKYLSASTLKDGAPTMKGIPHYIDIDKFEKSGGKIYSTSEIITHLEKYKEGLFTESAKARIDKLISVVKNTEHEVLLEGNVTPDMIKSKGTMRLVKGLRVVAIVGIVLSAYELGKATNESIEEDSAKPIVAEVTRQAGGWGGAAVGAKIGASFGAAIGLATGPGAIISGVAGGLIFGTAGYFGADWIADHINEN